MPFSSNFVVSREINFFMMTKCHTLVAWLKRCNDFFKTLPCSNRMLPLKYDCRPLRQTLFGRRHWSNPFHTLATTFSWQAYLLMRKALIIFNNVFMILILAYKEIFSRIKGSMLVIIHLVDTSIRYDLCVDRTRQVYTSPCCKEIASLYIVLYPNRTTTLF